MEKYLCIKNWEADSGIYFEEGKHYLGRAVDGGKMKMYGEVGMVVTFKNPNNYFQV